MNKITITSPYFRRGVFKVLLLSLFIVKSQCSFSMDLQQQATRQTALAAFEKNDHESALKQFSELSSTYPKDPLYKYYCGVCLVKLEREPSRAASLLNDALKGSATIVIIPDDALFWFGRAQQMSGKFTEAIGSFEKYSAEAGKKMTKEMNVPGYIKQCQERKGIVEETVVPAAVLSVSEPDKISAGEKQQVTSQNSVAEAQPVPPENPSKTYDSLMTAALAFQLRSDSLSSLAEKLNKQLAVTEGAARNELKTRTQNAEKLAAENKSMAAAVMAEARKLDGKDPLPETVPAEPQISAEPPAADTLLPAIPSPAATVAVIPDKVVYSEFEIIEKPVYKPGDKVEVNPEVPPGLIYRIQVAVFRNPVAPSYFKGIKPVHGFRNDANGITTYYAGMFRKSSDASKALTKVRGLGFKDSFVSPLMDKKAVSADRAALLEKEWGTKPLYTIKPATPDTTPRTLVFRVEIKRSPKPLPSEQIENMKKLAGTRGFDIIVTEKKESIYLAGKFLSFKSASEYTDLLIRNGYRDSKVVAYLGNSEISVETAKMLFDEH